MENVVQTTATPKVDYSQMPELSAGIPLERLTRKEFFSTHGIKGIESRLNQTSTETGNGVYFIQAYTENGKCHNLMFSKNAAATLEEMDMEKGSLIEPTFFQHFRFMWSSTSEEGVMRWKVVSAKEGGNRVSEDYFQD